MNRLWNKCFTLLFIIQTLDILTYNMITPIVAKYATSEGATIIQAGVIASSFMLAAVIVRPLSGFVSDRANRKRLILITVSVCCLCLFGYAVSSNLIAFGIFRVIHGFAYALFGTVIAAAAFSFIPEGRKSEGMGFFSLSYTIGSALGPGIGIFVSDGIGYVWLFIVAGIALLFSVALVLPLPDIPAPKLEIDRPKGIRNFISVKALPIMFIMIILCSNWGVISTFIVLTADVRKVVGIAAFFTVNAIALFLLRPPAGRFVDRHGLSKLFYPAIAFESIAMAALAFAQQLWVFIVIAVLKAMGHGVIHPALQAKAIELEPSDRSGVATSTFLLGTDIGYMIGPIFGAIVLENAGYTSMYLACVPVTLIAAAIFFVWSLRTTRSSKE